MQVINCQPHSPKQKTTMISANGRCTTSPASRSKNEFCFVRWNEVQSPRENLFIEYLLPACCYGDPKRLPLFRFAKKKTRRRQEG
ncbi:hypothetical protein CEXT_369881 [Caerostris extrusa]|uniref:Uncharacterized protein n=1 Tax=Caerostris extrusa TaxID=172846 RepID=A0AAV4UP73_CAEEX|nr:hypothetical protein CEXT_369881 [Caerostris extrusa]